MQRFDSKIILLKKAGLSRSRTVGNRRPPATQVEYARGIFADCFIENESLVGKTQFHSRILKEIEVRK